MPVYKLWKIGIAGRDGQGLKTVERRGTRHKIPPTWFKAVVRGGEGTLIKKSLTK